MVPRVVVRNTGVEPADLVRVWYKVDHHGTQRYLDSARIVNLPPRSADTVEFSSWVVNGRDSMTGVVWVYWAGDSLRRDDTLRNRFLARVRDAAARSVILPADTLDSGVVFVPQASIWNFGNSRESIPVRFDIKLWTSTGFVFVSPGGARSASAVSQYRTIPGDYVPCFRSALGGDMHPENDAVLDTFWVRGTIAHDVGVSSPEPGRVDTTMLVVPSCTLANNGLHSEQCQVWLALRDPAGSVVSSESTQATLPAGSRVLVSLPPVRLRQAGIYTASCSTFLDVDQNMLNDLLRWRIEVVTGVAEAEGRLQRRSGLVVQPGIVAGGSVVLWCPEFERTSVRVEICDVSGRSWQQCEMVTGPEGRLSLDVSDLAAGVYMVRLRKDGAGVSGRLVVGR